MANRVVEVLYRLRDLFSGQVKKIAAGYRDIESASDRAATRVENNNKRAKSSFDKLAGAIGKLRSAYFAVASTIAGAGIARSFSDIVDQADRVGKAASKIGITTEALSKLAFAASKENIDFGALEIGLQRMTRRIGAAVQGSAELQNVFTQLGLDVNELAQLSPDQAFLRIADATKAIGNEKEQLALFFKIFDTEGVNLIRLARQGSAAINELGNEAERLGRVFGSDFTQAAAQFNDRLTELGARIDGLKIRAFSEPLKEIVEFLDNTGKGDYLTGLTTELLLLEQQVQRPWYERIFGFRGHQNVDTMRERIEELKKEIDEYRKTQEKAATAAGNEEEAARRRQELNEQNAQSLEQLTDAYKQAGDERKAALAKETAELKKARDDQAAIEREFKTLVSDIVAPDVEDIGLGNIFASIRAARRAAEQGNLDDSIEFARKGGDLLQSLKEKGTESQLVLKFLAEQLAKVANEAAAKRTELELVDEQQARAAFDAIKAQADILKDTASKAGGEYAQAFLNAMRAEFERVTLPAPKVATPLQASLSTTSSFAPSSRSELEKRGIK